MTRQDYGATPAASEDLVRKVDLAALEAATADTGWIAPTLTGTPTAWSNYGSGYAPAGYRKIGQQVFLKGLVVGGTINTQIFLLPTGFRPAGITFINGIVSGKNIALSVYGTTDTAGGQTSTTGGGTHSHAITHSHNVTSTGTGLESYPGLLSIDTAGVVIQAGATHNGWQGLWGSFFID